MTQENHVPFRCEISTSDANVPLHLRVILDDQVILDQPHVTDLIPFECWIPDTEQQHTLIFEMSGKTHEHTVINDAGDIVKDAFLKLTNFSIDEIELNNVKTFEFTTPFYLWLLENM